MSRRIKLCLLFVFFGLLVTSAKATPIRVTIVGDRYAFPGRTHSIVQDGVMGQKFLPDDFPAQGFGFSWTTSYSESFQYGGHAGLTFVFDRLASGAPAEGSPSVTIKAILDGRILGPPYEHYRYPFGRLSLYSIESSLANWSTDSDIPSSVIETFLNPQDLGMSATASGSYTVDAGFWIPPVPVPEPTTYATWSLVALGAFVIRRRRHAIRLRSDSNFSLRSAS